MKPQHLKIGFAYDLPVADKQGQSGEVETVTAEYEDERTVNWIRATLQDLGDVIDLPWSQDIVARLAQVRPDVIFNITEAAGGRNRESLIPALAEAKGIPCTGSDAMAMGLSLDKHLTKILAQHAGVRTPNFVKVDTLVHWEAYLPQLRQLQFPVIAKPNCGGSSMGIRTFSRVESLDDLRGVVKWILENFADSALIEEFVFGREFTVGLLANPTLTVLPIAEIYIEDGAPDRFFSYEKKATPDKEEVLCPANPPDPTAKIMAADARHVFQALGCQDIARVDFRLDTDNVPYFLEINPLPGLSPYYSSFPAQAEVAGISHEEIIYHLVHNALARK